MHAGLVGRPERNRSLGRQKCSWNDNIEINEEIGYDGADWINLAKNKVQ
jgi:hypothetical protein